MLIGSYLSHSINASKYGRQGNGQDGVRQNASIQRGGELLHWFSTYRENGKVVEKSFPNDIDSGNEEDSELGEDPEVYFDEEPIVAYLNNPDCNNSADNGD